MTSLKEMLMTGTGLPLNRKEKFYTGTVFPMIVCKDNFKHLHLLLSLLGIPHIPDIVANSNESNILFFTEYNLVDAIKNKQKTAINKIYKNVPEKEDVPDIVMLIQSKINILVVFEAKMYDLPSAKDLEEQMENQQNILNFIQENFGVNQANTYHYALLPEKLKIKLKKELSYKVVTWEEIYKKYVEYEPEWREDYFFELLRIALEEYDQLAANNKGGENCEKKLSGDKIYTGFKEGTIIKLWIGRQGGIKGKGLKNDMDNGKWKTIHYQTNSNEPEGNPNWFSVEEFIQRIDAIKPRPAQN